MVLWSGVEDFYAGFGVWLGFCVWARVDYF